MKILVYTKIERNTGGDEAFLFIITQALVKNLSNDTTINLCLSYDIESEERAKSIKIKWNNMLSENELEGTVWTSVSKSKDTSIAACIKSDTMTNLGGDTIASNLLWKEFTAYSKTADLFVMAGWAHLQSKRSVDFLKNIAKLPASCKILACSHAGLNIDNNGFLREIQVACYTAFGLQLGVGSLGGLPMPSSLDSESFDSIDVRKKWLSHIGTDYDDCISEEGTKCSDKLVAIYCSKDAPGENGAKFIERIANQHQSDLFKYPVLLIGANESSKAYQEWVGLCTTLYGFKSCKAIERTNSTQVLMRGLRDAEYSMATGVFSILEARYLEIDHCEYLCPPHLEQLGSMLSNASSEAIKLAFDNGIKALEELSRLPTNDFQPVITAPENAWGKMPRDGWNNYLSSSSSNKDTQLIESSAQIEEVISLKSK